MKKFLTYYQQQDTVGRTVLLFSAITIALLVVFIVYPMKREISTEGDFNTTIWAEDGTPLAYNHFADGRTDNIPLLNMDSTHMQLFRYLWLREDPGFLKQNSILGSRGVSLRNFLPIGGGGSTITQQYLKWLSNSEIVEDFNRRSYISKIGEISGAYKITSYYKPEEILQLYVNKVAFLRGNFSGIQLGSLSFFNARNINELNLYEQYLIARSVRGDLNFKKITQKDNTYLDSLFSQSFNTMLIKNHRANDEELNRMLSYPLRFREKDKKLDIPYIFDLIKPLNDTLKREGYQYISSLKTDVLNAVNSAYKKYANEHKNILYVEDNVLDAQSVVFDLTTGKIVGLNTMSLAEPKDKNQRIPNRIFNAKPMASLIKSLIIGKGIELGLLNENTVSNDKYVGRVHNYDDKYVGKISLFDAIKMSKNTPFDNIPNRNLLVNSLEEDFNRIFGNELKPLPLNWNPSQYILGQQRQFSLPQIGMLYCALLSDGVFRKQRIIQQVISTDKYPFDTIYNYKPENYRLYSNSTCSTMKQLLKAPLEEGGTLYSLSSMLNCKQIMGKSGTSDKYEYGWTALANDKYLVITSITYMNMQDSNVKIPIPGRAGAASAGVISALIINNLLTL